MYFICKSVFKLIFKLTFFLKKDASTLENMNVTVKLVKHVQRDYFLVFTLPHLLAVCRQQQELCKIRQQLAKTHKNTGINLLNVNVH